MVVKGNFPYGGDGWRKGKEKSIFNPEK